MEANVALSHLIDLCEYGKVTANGGGEQAGIDSNAYRIRSVDVPDSGDEQSERQALFDKLRVFYPYRNSSVPAICIWTPELDSGDLIVQLSSSRRRCIGQMESVDGLSFIAKVKKSTTVTAKLGDIILWRVEHELSVAQTRKYPDTTLVDAAMTTVQSITNARENGLDVVAEFGPFLSAVKASGDGNPSSLVFLPAANCLSQVSLDKSLSAMLSTCLESIFLQSNTKSTDDSKPQQASPSKKSKRKKKKKKVSVTMLRTSYRLTS